MIASLVLVSATGLLYVARVQVLTGVGLFFTSGSDDESLALKKFDLVVVHDPSEDRLIRADALVRRKQASSMLVACPVVYDVSSCTLVRDAVTKMGHELVPFESFPTGLKPSEDKQAAMVVARLKEKRTGFVAIIVPNYRVRRLAPLYRHLCAKTGIVVLVFSSPTDFDPYSWWRSPESQKKLLGEMFPLFQP